MAVTDGERRALGRAFELALRGPRGVNPQVGAVILRPDGEVLAEGWHRGAGTPHAEVAALSQLSPGEASGATAVVTLEPCNHTGRTGPCSEALIGAGIARVLYSVPDPGAESGGGADRLRQAGLDVEGGVEQERGRAVLASWLALQQLDRPHVTVKWAQSLDGRAAAPDGTSQWITGSAAREDVHRRRSLADAIVAGTGTVLADDPALTARDATGELLARQPLPVVIGARDIPEDAAVRHHPRELVQYGDVPLWAADAEPSVLGDLYDRGVRSVFVEGGPTLASAFLREGLADTVLTYIAPTLLGGPVTAVGDVGVGTITDQRRLDVESVERIGDDILITSHPGKQE